LTVRSHVESAVVDGQQPATTQTFVCLDGLLRLHVDVGPLLVVRAGHDHGHVEGREASPDLLEAPRAGRYLVSTLHSVVLFSQK